jgi:YVTN family beta-propeller protein
VTGIALSPDGRTLYAALASGHAVSAINTMTLQQTASYPVGDANTPCRTSRRHWGSTPTPPATAGARRSRRPRARAP